MTTKYFMVQVMAPGIDMMARGVYMWATRNVDMRRERRVDMLPAPASAASGRVDMPAEVDMMAEHVMVEMGFGIDVRLVVWLVDVDMLALIHMMTLNRAVNVGTGINMIIIFASHDASLF